MILEIAVLAAAAIAASIIAIRKHGSLKAAQKPAQSVKPGLIEAEAVKLEGDA